VAAAALELVGNGDPSPNLSSLRAPLQIVGRRTNSYAADAFRRKSTGEERWCEASKSLWFACRFLLNELRLYIHSYLSVKPYGSILLIA